MQLAPIFPKIIIALQLLKIDGTLAMVGLNESNDAMKCNVLNVVM